MLGSTFAAMMFDHPPPPVDVVASESPSGVQISWTEIPEEFFATGYNIYRSMVSTMADPAVKVNEQPLQGSSFLDSTVFQGAMSCYTIRSVGQSGLEGDDSMEACASFQPNLFGQFKRGGLDGSTEVDVSDSIRLLEHLFLGTFQPGCLDAADVDDSGRVDTTDAVTGLEFLFLGVSAPASPGAFACGFDETSDGTVELGCNEHPCNDFGT